MSLNIGDKALTMLRSKIPQYVTQNNAEMEIIIKEGTDAELTQLLNLIIALKISDAQQLATNIITRYQTERQRRESAIRQNITNNDVEVALLLNKLDPVAEHAFYDTLLNKQDINGAKMVAMFVLYQLTKSAKYFGLAMQSLGLTPEQANFVYNNYDPKYRDILVWQVSVNETERQKAKNTVQKFLVDNGQSGSTQSAPVNNVVRTLPAAQPTTQSPQPTNVKVTISDESVVPRSPVALPKAPSNVQAPQGDNVKQYLIPAVLLAFLGSKFL